MKIEEAIKIMRKEKGWENNDSVILAFEMAINALKLQVIAENNQTQQAAFDDGYNDGCVMTEKIYQEKIKKCIEKIDEELRPDIECFDDEDDFIWYEEKHNRYLTMIKEELL